MSCARRLLKYASPATQRADATLSRICERRIDFVFRAGPQHIQPQAKHLGGAPRFGLDSLRRRASRIHQNGNGVATRNHLVEQLKALCCETRIEIAHAGEIAARSVQTGHEAGGDRVDAADKHDRDRRRCRLGRECRREIGRSDDCDLAVDEIGGKLRQSLIAAFGPAIFDCDVLVLDKASLTQALAKSGHQVRSQFG